MHEMMNQKQKMGFGKNKDYCFARIERLKNFIIVIEVYNFPT